MTTIKQLLGQGDVKKPKRNFLYENVRRLKDLKTEKGNKINSQSNRNVQILSERKNATESLQRLGGPPPLRWQMGNSPPLCRRPGMTKSLTLEKPQQTPVVAVTPEQLAPKGFRSQACQTLNSKQLETLYYEGIIRYPSARASTATVCVREMGLQTDVEAPVEVLHSPRPPEETALPHTSAEIGLQWDEDRSTEANKDFVKMNATIPEPQKKTAESRHDPNRAPLTYQRGVVPKYLKAHKKELEKDRISRARMAADECPEGHVTLPDEIRLSHLTTLKQKYEELVGQLNQLPVSTDTLRTRNRKKQIEGELDKIEAAINLFSREKVFVKANS